MEKRDPDSSMQEAERFGLPLGPFALAAETTRTPTFFCDGKEAGYPFVFANDSFLALSGYTREELIGKSLDFLMAAPADARSWAPVDAAFGREDGDPISVECRRKDGTRFLAAIYVSLIRDQHGEIAQYCASLFDLSSQVQQSERDISALHTLCENTPGFIAILAGPDHRYTFANASHHALVNRGALLGRTVDEVLPELAAQGIIGLLDRVFTSGEPFVGKSIALGFGGGPHEQVKRLLLDFVCEPVRDSRDIITGIFCAGHDVTDRVAAEEVIGQAPRLPQRPTATPSGGTDASLL